MVMGSIATGTEVLVIGGGPGGYTAAHRAAQLGKEVTLIEMTGHLGGVCLQEGCIPSKALISSGNIVEELKAAGERGILAKVEGVDGARLQEWKQKVVDRLEKGVWGMMKAGDVNVVTGRAQFTGPSTVTVTPCDGEGPSQAFHFEQCIIATGSAEIELKFLPFDGERVIGSREALALQEIPRHLVVVGGGIIGLELGIAYRKLGAEVTVVEALDRVLSIVEPELTNVLMRRLRKLGITVHTSARALGLAEDGGLRVEAEGKEQVLPADKILVAVGRKPLSYDLNLEAAGVQTDAKGYIPVNERCETNVKNIYAIGDVTGNPMLAHRAHHMGTVAAEVIAGQPSACDWVGVPGVIFTDPEVAYIGLSETEAKEAGYEVQVGKFHFVASGRAQTHGHTDGLVKVVADARTGVVLGVHMIGPEVSELIAEAVHAMEMGATVEDIAKTIHPHPTLSESVMEAAAQVWHNIHKQ